MMYGWRSSRTTPLLWEFLLSMLQDEDCKEIIEWTDKSKKTFKIINSHSLANLWGEIKGRPNMNQSNLRRAIRLYYKRGIMRKVVGQKGGYKFENLPYNPLLAFNTSLETCEGPPKFLDNTGTNMDQLPQGLLTVNSFETSKNVPSIYEEIQEETECINIETNVSQTIGPGKLETSKPLFYRTTDTIENKKTNQGLVRGISETLKKIESNTADTCENDDDVLPKHITSGMDEELAFSDVHIDEETVLDELKIELFK